MVLFLLLLVLLLSTPFVQTKLGKIATERINKDFETNIVVKKLDLSLLGSVRLKEIQIRDHHQDTLIFVNKLTTSLLNVKKILDNKLNLGDASLSDVYFYMKTYKNEDNDNMSIFLDRFEDEESIDSLDTPFILRSKNIDIDNLTFKLLDENKKDPLEFAAYNGGGSVQNFLLKGADVSMKAKEIYFTDNRGIAITNLSTDFSYKKTQMLFNKTTLETKNSKLNGDIVFDYDRKDFQYFTDKVKLKAAFQESSLSLKDLHKVYKELRGDDVLNFTGSIHGTLNNFSAENINLHSKKGMIVIGNMGFVNALNDQRGFIFDGNLKNVTANYDQLKSGLPNLLGKTLPTEFKRLGNFTLSGIMRVTPQQMDATLNIVSDIGAIVSDLKLTNIETIDDATYDGEVAFKDFDLGIFTNDPILGKISLQADVQGSGFKLDNINTSIIGVVSELVFKGYNYKNLDINGQFQNKKFDGLLNANDPNLKMNFEGLADFSSEINEFDFKAKVERIDLRKTNLFLKDSISVLKGAVTFDVNGNTLDDMVGRAIFKDIVYTNQKKVYPFKKFKILSSVKDSIKTISIDSKDIVEGKLEGKFTFDELLPITQNALGSVYTNYTPYPVAPHQFLDFNFTIYNQIIAVFSSDLSIGDSTKIKGKIKADQNSLKLTFSSPKIEAYENKVEKVLLRMDNKNPLYNTHLTIDRVRNKYYDVSKLNLLNRTENDTLFFKSVFKGGKGQAENFNLDFFYTINKEKKSVVGIQKSTFNFKENKWLVNPLENKENKVTFNLKTKEFELSPFTFISNEQKIEFEGVIKGEKHKKLQAEFTKVKLGSFLPSIDSLALKGVLSGAINFGQDKGIYNPRANLLVENFYINEHAQGDLSLDVKGDNSYEKYDANLTLVNDMAESISAKGTIDFSEVRPVLDMVVFLKKYQINGFGPLGGEVLSKLRGEMSGNFTAKGFLRNPDFKGVLEIENGGLTFPYLNIDFDLKGNTRVKLENQSFIWDNIVLEDTKYKTKGSLSGAITHQNFEQWFLNLKINTDNLLVLDTKEREEVAYYGTGFLKGDAKITGLTSSLTIDVNGSTEPGTVFVIPLSDVKMIDNYKLIHFKSEEKKRVVDRLAVQAVEGLNLNINLNVTKEALAQVVIDKASGSELKGSGEGSLQIEINTRGKFNMYGDFIVDNGVYNFKYGGVVNKPFVVQKGGRISWNGDPFEAELDIIALYETKANPAQLLENIQGNRKIPIDLYTKITGGLFSSKQDFDIKIPNANSTIASELEFKLNDNDKNSKMRQFFSLLATGSFFSEDNLGVNASSALAGTTSDLISNILSDVLNSKDAKFKLGVDYTQGDRSEVESLKTDNQVDVSVTTQLSDRVIVNGKVGVPVGTNTQTSVVGEVKVEVLLNEQGNFRGTVFNRQNDIQYSTEEEGYTQGVGLSYEVNFNNLSELAKKIGLKKQEPLKKKDSLLKKRARLIHFRNKKAVAK
ncbi:conserved hypothetical protein [Tenacibaculum maritimum]|nr:conserved hypothetical protein [Tenacibaculum maritimum]